MGEAVRPEGAASQMISTPGQRGDWVKCLHFQLHVLRFLHKTNQIIISLYWLYF